MGLAAGQARLLSITARLTDNENSAQALSYSKQRLADQAEQVNAEYIAALDATKLTVLTGFNGSVPNYTDISYGLMTNYNTVACGKQYVVTDQKGRILVTDAIKTAYEASNGDINKFLEKMTVNGKTGFSQVDIDVNSAEGEQKIHEAWDKYITSVGTYFPDIEHDFSNENVKFGLIDVYDYTDKNNPKLINQLPVVYINKDDGTQAEYPLNYEGTTKEQRELYDYAVALTRAKYGTPPDSKPNAIVDDPENADIVTYLKNIFNQMKTFGYVTSEDAFHLEEKKSIKDNTWFEDNLKKGKLLLKAFSSTEKDFVTTTLSDDTAIQEVEDERKLALAEAKYTQDMTALESKDQKFDLELKKLDTEHSALQTEYDSLKSVVDKNVEKSFNIFS